MSRVILRLRGVDPTGSLEAFGESPPFRVLERSPTSWTAAIASGPDAVPEAVIGFRAVSRPGADGWSRVHIDMTGEPFGRFSKLIARRWLRAVKLRAIAVR